MFYKWTTVLICKLQVLLLFIHYIGKVPGKSVWDCTLLRHGTAQTHMRSSPSVKTSVKQRRRRPGQEDTGSIKCIRKVQAVFPLSCGRTVGALKKNTDLLTLNQCSVFQTGVTLAEAVWALSTASSYWWQGISFFKKWVLQ